MRLFRDPYFFAVALNHLVVDVLNSQLAVVLAFLVPTLGLSNSDIGLVTTGYLLLSSLSQPIFGWLADRYGPRWLNAGGLMWMAGWFALAAHAPGRATLLLFVIGGLGSAAFHPTGTEQATARGRVLMAGRAATASSIFFLFGKGGLALGPAIGGALIDRLGLAGVLVLCVAAVPVAVNTFYRLRAPARVAHARSVAPHDVIGEPQTSQPTLRTGPVVFAAFALMVALWATPQQVSVTFIPKLLADRGYSPAAYGAVAALFTGGSALAGVLGGAMADHWGRRRTILLAFVAAVLPLYFYPVTEGPLMYALVLLAGATIGAAHSIIVVLAQALMPNRMALASGLTLGFIFSSGSLGTLLFGMLADTHPLPSVMRFGAFLMAVAALLSLTLRREERSARSLAGEFGSGPLPTQVK